MPFRLFFIVFQVLLNHSEVADGLEPDFEDAFQIDGIDTALTGFESDRIPNAGFAPFFGNGADNHIAQEEIFGYHFHHFLQSVGFHQAEGGVGIFYPFAENDPYQQTQHSGYDNSSEAVLPVVAGTDDEMILFFVIPKFPKFTGVGLSVGVGLEYIVCTFGYGFAVGKQYGGAVAGISLVDRQQIRIFFLQRLHDIVSMVFAAVIDDHQTGVIADFFHYRMPL